MGAGSWTLYDFANTVYAATVAYLFLPTFEPVIDDAFLIGLAMTGSMLLAGLLVPILGAFCDRTGRARSYLVITTSVCIACMSGLSVSAEHATRSLLLFAVANVSFQSALVCYNALLPSVVSTERAGLVSGIGTGIGYLGTIVTLMVVPMLDPSDDGRIRVAAALFLVAALPCLLLVKDRASSSRERASFAVARQSLSGILSTIRRLPKERTLFLFLLGNFCLLDVLNTAIFYFGIIAKQGFVEMFESGGLEVFGTHFTKPMEFVYAAGTTLNVLAFVFGTLLGFLSDRWSAIGVMRLSGWSLVIALICGGLFVGRDAEAFMLTLVPLGAFGLAGLWTAGRKVVLQLAPVAQRGEYFGLYGLTSKVSVVGTLTFLWIKESFDFRSALWVQILPALVGLALLHAVRIEKHKAKS